MFAELGRMKVRRRTTARIELGLDRLASALGWVAVVIALALAVIAAPIANWLAVVALIGAAVAALVATARHQLVFDREDGVVRIERRVAGITSRSVIPLFHLRAVVVRRHGRGFVAVIERRNGGAITIDSSDRPGRLYELVRAVADVTELRLVYDTTQAS